MLNTAFSLWGSAVSWLEILAFVLALANIACNVREIHWGWPLSLLASALYAWLFFVSQLYGEAGVNVFFALISLWGWWQWLHGRRAASGAALQLARLQRRGLALTLLAWLVLWLSCAALLRTITDSTLPWADGFVTAGSIVATVLLGRKYLENWPLWLLVNVASVALFAYKGLTLTLLLYAIFCALALWGWLGWRQRLVSQPTA